MLNVILDKKEKLFELCIEHKVRSLYAFGSVCTDKFTSRSDIDLLVEFDELSPVEAGENFMSMERDLNKLFGRKIDLVSTKYLSNPYFIDNLNKNKVLIYDGYYQEAFV